MRGYLFSLESLIAIIILLFPVIVFNPIQAEFDTKRSNIYEGLSLLEKENELTDNADALKINNFLDLNISISECDDKEIIDYLVVLGTDDFKIIKICY